ncbi:MAG: DUF3152 domain-containing protein [Nocardioidaceae bacterium]
MRFAVVLVTFLASGFLAAPAHAGDPALTSLTPPTIAGQAVFGRKLKVTAGTWDQAGVVTTFQWQRDGKDIAGATTSGYRIARADIGHRLGVIATGILEGFTDGTSVSDLTAKVTPATITVTKRVAIGGSLRFRHVARAKPATWSVKPANVRYQWLRNGTAIKGATTKRYTIAVPDVGAKLTVRATATKPGYRAKASTSKAKTGRHLRALKRTFTYVVTTRGHLTAGLAQFAKQAQQTYDDPRGWRSAGYAFKRVERGGDFTLVLSQASQVPTFGYPCSSTYSCRVGRYVIINQDRWLRTTPVWKKSGLGRRNYRHLVVNHETGHWLGHRHEYCGGRGQLAPVMQQQSKGLQGCKANPWPLPHERW